MLVPGERPLRLALAVVGEREGAEVDGHAGARLEICARLLRLGERTDKRSSVASPFSCLLATGLVHRM